LHGYSWAKRGGNQMFHSLRLRFSGEEGQTLIEYALIVSLISVVSIIALKATGTSISGILNHISQAV
jgi:Flp pilus assembly pilin Flp